MTIFRSRALDGLDTIYRFPGGRGAPEEVDVSAPVQLVHDVSRTAELVTGITYVFEQTILTAGLGNDNFESVNKGNLITSVNAIAARAKNLGLTEQNTDVWLLNVSAFATKATAANISFCAAGIYPPADAPAATELYASMIGFFNTTTGAVTLEGGGTYTPLHDNTAARSSFLSRLPRRIGSLRAIGVDDGAAAAEFSLRYLVSILPKGVRPIGG